MVFCDLLVLCSCAVGLRTAPGFAVQLPLRLRCAGEGLRAPVCAERAVWAVVRRRRALIKFEPVRVLWAYSFVEAELFRDFSRGSVPVFPGVSRGGRMPSKPDKLAFTRARAKTCLGCASALKSITATKHRPRLASPLVMPLPRRAPLTWKPLPNKTPGRTCRVAAPAREASLLA